MINKILGKLPRKPSKSVDREFGNSSVSYLNTTGSRASDLVTSVPLSSSSSSLLAPGAASSAAYGQGNKVSTVENSKVNGSAVISPYEALPGFRDVSNSEKQNLFISKLNLCCVLFDFTDSTKHIEENEIKRQTLLELVEYVTTVKDKFTENVMKEVLKMVYVNLFRSLNAQPRESKVLETVDLEDEEPLMDPAWCHLQIVLLDLFDSEDPREREYLKTILHRIYGRFMVHRPFIRESINNIFFRFIFETEKFNGIAELLELSNCVTQFVEKDCKLSDTVVSGLLKYWPITNSSKEVMFLTELEEILGITQPAEFQRCMVPLFRKISCCLSSSHFQVAERALYLWNSEHIENLIRQNCEVILPIIFPALERSSHAHWNQVVRSLTLNVRKIFSEVDPELFDECLHNFLENESIVEAVTRKCEASWKHLEEIAASKAASSATIVVPTTIST
ncbi:hypothetical protein K1719_003190 [Acacia pycnantha]|nr:hypothetical protein K1719_003190 [Acacia pycnantha]